MACGQGATIATGTTNISTTGNGTSFSSPILAGMSACLWQSHPDMTMMEIYESIRESGSLVSDPNDLMGWGIPNFNEADSTINSNYSSLI